MRAKRWHGNALAVFLGRIYTDLTNDVKAVAGIIRQKLYNLSMGNRIISHRLDRLFVELNNEAPHYIQRSLFDSGLAYALDKKWIECGETANEVRITTDGYNEVLARNSKVRI